MIRFTPIVKGGLTYDPVASTLTACAPIFRQKGVKRLRFEVFSGELVPYPIDGTFADTTLSASDRETLTRSERFEMTVHLTMADSEKTMKVIVINDCQTIPHVKLNPKFNSNYGGIDYAHIEAYNPSTPRSSWKQVANMVGSVAYAGMPFFNNIVYDVRDNEIEVHGPDAHLMFAAGYLCNVTCGQEGDKFTFPVFARTMLDKKQEEPIPVDPETKTDFKVPFKYWFRRVDTGDKVVAPTLCQLTQTTPVLDHRSLSGQAYFYGLCIAAVHEFSNQRGELTTLSLDHDEKGWYIDCRLSGNKIELTQAMIDIYNTHVVPNNQMRAILKAITVDTDSVYINVGKTRYLVSSSYSTAACYALAAAVYISARWGDGSVITALSALQALISAGLLTKGSESDETGAYKIRGGGATANGLITVQTPSGTVTGKIERDGRGNEGDDGISKYRKAFDDATNGTYFILGYDPWSRNVAAGEPDHYILCVKWDGKLIAVFDPYRKDEMPVSCGADMTNIMLHGQDARLIWYNAPNGVAKVVTNGDTATV